MLSISEMYLEYLYNMCWLMNSTYKSSFHTFSFVTACRCHSPKSWNQVKQVSSEIATSAVCLLITCCISHYETTQRFCSKLKQITLLLLTVSLIGCYFCSPKVAELVFSFSPGYTYRNKACNQKRCLGFAFKCTASVISF